MLKITKVLWQELNIGGFKTLCTFQATAKRTFAAQAVAKTERELIKAEPLKVSTLSNGLTIASLENYSPVTTIGVAIKAGARNEGYDNAGVTRALGVASEMNGMDIQEYRLWHLQKSTKSELPYQTLS